MKRTVAIFLTILFLAFNTGLALNVHFCQGRINKISVLQKVGCHNEGDRCCKDIAYQLSMKSDFIANGIILSWESDILLSPVLHQTIYLLSHSVSIAHGTHVRMDAQPIYLANRQLLI
jgi:hypothetical protein